MTAQSARSRYKKLSDFLLQKFGEERTQASVAQEALVTPGAVHYWLTGQCRPKPRRLGLVAAILELKPAELVDLAELAEYDGPSDFGKIVAAYDWYRARQNFQKRGDGCLVFKRDLCERLASKIKDVMVTERLLDEEQWKELKPSLVSELMSLEL